MAPGIVADHGNRPASLSADVLFAKEQEIVNCVKQFRFWDGADDKVAHCNPSLAP